MVTRTETWMPSAVSDARPPVVVMMSDAISGVAQGGARNDKFCAEAGANITSARPQSAAARPSLFIPYPQFVDRPTG